MSKYREEVLERCVKVKYLDDESEGQLNLRGAIKEVNMKFVDGKGLSCSHLIVFMNGDKGWYDLDELESCHRLQWPSQLDNTKPETQDVTADHSKKRSLALSQYSQKKPKQSVDSSDFFDLSFSDEGDYSIRLGWVLSDKPDNNHDHRQRAETKSHDSLSRTNVPSYRGHCQKGTDNNVSPSEADLPLSSSQQQSRMSYSCSLSNRDSENARIHQKRGHNYHASPLNKNFSKTQSPEISHEPVNIPKNIDQVIRYMDSLEPGENYFFRQQDNRGGCSKTRQKLRQVARKNPTHPGVKHYVETDTWGPPDIQSLHAMISLIKTMIR